MLFTGRLWFQAWLRLRTWLRLTWSRGGAAAAPASSRLAVSTFVVKGRRPGHPGLVSAADGCPGPPVIEL